MTAWGRQDEDFGDNFGSLVILGEGLQPVFWEKRQDLLLTHIVTESAYREWETSLSDIIPWQ